MSQSGGVTQSERVLAFLRENYLPTALDIAHGCHPWVSNPRARISDLRAAGHVIRPVRRSDGKTGFLIVEATPVQTALFFSETA
jgi:hypothetical protein